MSTEINSEKEPKEAERRKLPNTLSDTETDYRHIRHAN